MCRSVPQIEATFTFTSTSLRPIAGILTSRISVPGAAAGFTTACIVIAMIATYESGNQTQNGIKHKTYDSSTAGGILLWLFPPLRRRKRANRSQSNGIQHGAPLRRRLKSVRARLIVIFLICVSALPCASASPVQVRYKEGLLHGFLV